MKLLPKYKHLLPIIFTIILGSLSHFFYEWSGENPFVALISPINESTWEHLKLLFFPFFLFTVLEYAIAHPDFEAFFTARYFGVIIGMLTIVIGFYAYTGIIGTHVLIIDILLFIIAVIISYKVSDRIYSRRSIVFYSQAIFLLWFLTILFFFIFTGYPPNAFLFYPPSD